jgi:hypothetical protein
MSEHLAYTVRQVRGPPPSVEATPMRKSARSGCGGGDATRDHPRPGIWRPGSIAFPWRIPIRGQREQPITAIPGS